MLLQVPDVLTAEQVSNCHKTLEAAEWVDGRITAGHQSARAKDNLQLREDLAEAKQLGDVVLAALERNPLFMSAALLLKVFPPAEIAFGRETTLFLNPYSAQVLGEGSPGVRSFFRALLTGIAGSRQKVMTATSRVESPARLIWFFCFS